MGGELTISPDKRSLMVNTMIYAAVLATIFGLSVISQNAFAVITLYVFGAVAVATGYFNIRKLLSRRPSLRLSNDGVYIAGAYDLLIPWAAVTHAIVRERWNGMSMGIGVDQETEYFKSLGLITRLRLRVSAALTHSEIRLTQLNAASEFDPACSHINHRVVLIRGADALRIPKDKGFRSVFAKPSMDKMPDLAEAEDALRAAFRG